MKHTLIAILSFMTLITMADEPAVVQLTDGSRYVGTLASKTFELTTRYGKLRVPFDKLISIRIGEKASAMVLSDDNTISGKLTRKTVSLATSVGNLEIDLSKVVAIWPKERGGMFGGSGWGPSRNGLRLRARCATKEIKMGKSFDLILELKNFGSKARKVDFPMVQYCIDQWSRNRRTESVYLKIKKLRPTGPAEEQEGARFAAMKALTLTPGETLRIAVTVSTIDAMVTAEEAEALEDQVVKDLGGGVREVKLETKWEVYGAGSYEIRPIYQSIRYGENRHGQIKAPAIKIEVTK